MQVLDQLDEKLWSSSGMQCHPCSDGLQNAGAKFRVKVKVSKSSRVIHFGINQKRLYILLLVFNSNVDPIFNCTVSEIRRLKCRKSTIFPTPVLFWLKFGGGLFGVDPWCWSQPRLESQVHKIVIREIILEEFQRM